MTVVAPLAEIAEKIRTSRGLAHKEDVSSVMRRLGLANETGTVAIGDDCAAIPDGDGYLLLAIEGFLDEFVAGEPWFAGYCGVMVNVSDVAAMGGRPTAVVDAIWSRNGVRAAPVLAGLRAAADTYGVPIVGGHSNSRSDREQLAVAVLGRAKRLLTSFDGRSGDAIVAAIDLRGHYREPNPYWDASTGAAPQRLRADLEILPDLANTGLVHAGKDISMGGVVGTVLMLLECSVLGGAIDVTRVPRPEGVPLDRWLLSFPSFGFVFCVAPSDLDAVVSRFTARGIACASIGTADQSRVVRLVDAGQEAMVWDFHARALIGCATRPNSGGPA